MIILDEMRFSERKTYIRKLAFCGNRHIIIRTGIKETTNLSRKIDFIFAFDLQCFQFIISLFLVKKKKKLRFPIEWLSKKILHFPWSLEKQGTNVNKIRMADRFARVGKWNDRQFVTCCIEIRSPMLYRVSSW